MKLRLTLVRRPPAHAADLSRDLGNGRLTIGRGPDNDWILNDPERLLSKNHCMVEFKGGVYVVIDSSTNGVFLNDAAEPIGRGNAAVIGEGDRLRLGGFVVKAGFAADEPASADDPFLAVLRATDAPADDGFGAMAPASSGDPFAFPAAERQGATIMPIPDDDELFGPRPTAADPGAGDWQRTAATGAEAPPWSRIGETDHAAADLGAMRVAAAAPAIPDDWLDEPLDNSGASSGPNPGPGPVAVTLPDDWDDEPLVPPAFATRTAPGSAAPVRSPSPDPLADLARALAEAVMVIDRQQAALETLLGLDPDDTLDRTASPLRRAVDAGDAVERLLAEGPDRASAILRTVAAEGAAHQSALLSAVRELVGGTADGGARLAELYRRLLPMHRQALGGGSER